MFVTEIGVFTYIVNYQSGSVRSCVWLQWLPVSTIPPYIVTELTATVTKIVPINYHYTGIIYQ